jgi:hypothetical protein
VFKPQVDLTNLRTSTSDIPFQLLEIQLQTLLLIALRLRELLVASILRFWSAFWWSYTRQPLLTDSEVTLGNARTLHQKRLHFSFTLLELEKCPSLSRLACVHYQHDFHTATSTAHPHSADTASWSQVRQLRAIFTEKI